MNWIRWILILATVLIALYFLFQLEIWGAEYKDLFFYLGDWKSYIAAFALIVSVGMILKWFVKWEIRATEPKNPRRPGR